MITATSGRSDSSSENKDITDSSSQEENISEKEESDNRTQSFVFTNSGYDKELPIIYFD